MTTKNDNNNKEKNLYYLNELSDYKIADDDPDVRGWEVKDTDNRVVGKVDNLLVNKSTKRVVYLDVEVDKSIIEANHDPFGKTADSGVHEFINKEGENHLIIPVGMVNVNYDPDYVKTDKINHKTFAETKRMEKGYSINREYEAVVLESYGRRHEKDRDGNDHARSQNSNQNKDLNVGKDKERRSDDSFYNRDEFDDSNYRKR